MLIQVRSISTILSIASNNLVGVIAPALQAMIVWDAVNIRFGLILLG